MKLSGGHALMRSLIDHNVDILFGYPGGAIMPVYDALFDYTDKLQHILVRHEQGAAHAAEGYARVTGKPGVCLATSGPGATNLVTGIADAMIDSVPLVCITGQVAFHLVGTDAFQEADVIGITTPITKWNYQITTPSEIPYIVAKAFKIAMDGRPGPVLIDITKNAQIETFDFPLFDKKSIVLKKPKQMLNKKNLTEAATLINTAKKPYVLMGHGVLIAKAEKELQQFVEKADIPVASTLHGLSGIPASHKNYVGMLGMHGNYSTNMLTNSADVIVAIGMRFDDRVTSKVAGYAKQAKIIHIDIDAAEIDKIIKTQVALISDAKTALQKLLPLIKTNNHKKWISEFKTLDKMEHAKVIDIELQSTNNKIKMAQVVSLLSKKTKGQAIIVADVGQHQMITARYYKFEKPDSFLTSGGLGTMGYALPAAIGAKFGNPKRDVIAVIGDGSFQMTIQELATIAQENLPVKIIVLNNNFLGMVRQWQQLFFEKRYSFVDLKNPDFVQVVKGFRIPAEKIETIEQLPKALDRLLQATGPRFLEVVVEKEGNVFPMIPTGKSVDEVVLE